jgi:hypothetical protein
MSLIQDALKRKTEEMPPQSETPPPAGPSSISRPIFLSVAAVLILLVVGEGLYILMNRPPVTAAPAKTEVAAKPEPPPAVAKAPAAAPEPAPAPKVVWPKLTFSGSTARGDEILALIDGQMISKGSKINGITVLQVGNNKALLEFGGEKRLFRLLAK